MAFTPLYVGGTHQILQLTWKDDLSAVVNLTGATITMRYKGDVYTGADGLSHAGTGTVSNLVGASGTFNYAPSVADLAVPGTYQWQFAATFIDSTVLLSDPITIQIQAAI